MDKYITSLSPDSPLWAKGQKKVKVSCLTPARGLLVNAGREWFEHALGEKIGPLPISRVMNKNTMDSLLSRASVSE